MLWAAGRCVTCTRRIMREGLAESLKTGIAAVPPECAGAIVCLGDMPLVTGRMIDRLLAMYDPEEGRSIVLPTFRGKQGNPMIWDRRFFPEILGISGDSGARFLVGKHAEQVAEVEMADDAVLRDFDTTESLATLPPSHAARGRAVGSHADLRGRSLAVPVFRKHSLSG